MAKRSLKASDMGQAQAKKAFQRTGWTQAYLAEQVGLQTRQSVWKFFTGRPIERYIFIEICFQLDLEWQEIATLPYLDAPIQLVSEELTQLKIDTWVQKVRSQRRGQVQAQCGALQFFLDSSKPLQLNQVFTGVNFLPFLRHQQWQEISDLQRIQSTLSTNMGNSSFCPSFLKGIDIVQNHHKVVILGKPGAGKTTFLKHLALECNEGRYKPECIPIFLSLQTFASPQNGTDDISLLSVLHNQWQSCGLDLEQVKTILDSGRVLLLLDGLDEVPPSVVQTVLSQIQLFSDDYYRNQIFISCRIEAQRYHFRGFQYIEIADFLRSQVEVFARRYFVATARNSKTRGLTQASQFLYQLQKPENRPLENLTTSPLLMGLICSVFQQRSAFPTKRAKLYQIALDILIERWDQARGVQRATNLFSLSKPDTISLLCQIAFTTFIEGKCYFDQRQILNLIVNYLESTSTETLDFEILWSQSEAILKSIELRSGLLVQCAKSVYSFSHLTFQEYLTARKIVVNSTPEELQSSLKQLLAQVKDPRWREVIVLTASLLPSADSFIQQLHQQISKSAETDPTWLGFLEDLYSKVCSMGDHTIMTWAFYISLLIRQDGRLAQCIDPQFAQHLPADLAIDRALFLTLKAFQKVDVQNTFQLATHLSSLLTFEENNCPEPQVWLALKSLKDQIPKQSMDNEGIKTWWQQYGHSFQEKLQTILQEQRGFKSQWLTDFDKYGAFQQYYGTLHILLECLYGDCNISPQTRSKIEESLFLPKRMCKKQPLQTEVLST